MSTYFKKTVVLCVIAWMCFPMLYSQQGDTLFIRRTENGRIAFASFEIKENSDRKMNNDINFLKSILGLKEADEFRLKNATTDESGITHKRFQQYYKGIKVENSEYLLHGTGDNIKYINGYFQDINLKTVDPEINEQKALKKALEYAGAEKYKWEDPEIKFSFFVKSHVKTCSFIWK